MNIADHGTDVTGIHRTIGGFVDLFNVSNVILYIFIPVIKITLVHTVNLAFFRNANIGMGQDKLAVTGVKRKTIHAVAGGVNQHGAGTVDYIARAHLLVTRLHAVFQGTGTAIRRNTVEN